MTLGIVLLWDPRRGGCLMSEVPLYLQAREVHPVDLCCVSGLGLTRSISDLILTIFRPGLVLRVWAPASSACIPAEFSI